MVSLMMLRDHYDELAGGRAIGRVEFIPVQWHSRLHDDSTGLDRQVVVINVYGSLLLNMNNMWAHKDVEFISKCSNQYLMIEHSKQVL